MGIEDKIEVSLQQWSHHHQPAYTHCRTKAFPIFLQLNRSCASCVHLIPANFLISSVHLTSCRPLLCLPSLGIQSVTSNGHRLSCLHTTCPAHAYLFMISTRMPLTRVCSLTYSALFVAPNVMPTIDRLPRSNDKRGYIHCEKGFYKLRKAKKMKHISPSLLPFISKL